MRAKHSSRGFTLLELIVVITIIGLLSSIVVMSTRGVGPKARRTKALADMNNIRKTATAIYTAEGQWPETIEEMVNAEGPDGLPRVASLETYPKDPWGNDYLYEITGGDVVVRCLGNDNAEGGDGEAQDLVVPEGADEYAW